MKISLSIVILAVAISSYGQINKRTIAQRERYAKASVLQLKQHIIPAGLQKSFLFRGKNAASPDPITLENYLKHSSASLNTAFEYYHDIHRQPDHSGFLLLGYSFLANPQVSANNREDESVRFFPANIKD